MAGRTVWYPGHMVSGERRLFGLVEKLDVIVEVRDARAPHFTSSPLISRISKILPVEIVLSKKDLADEIITREWLDYFASRQTDSLKSAAKNGGLYFSASKHAWALDMRSDSLEPFRRAVLKLKPAHRELRLAVVGVPNVGKSFFLNSLVGKNAAKVGGIPGVTKGVSWYKGKEFLAVDSPGILDPHSGAQYCLAWLGSSKSEVIGGFETVALALIEFMKKANLWHVVEEKWGLELIDEPNEDTLKRVGVRLGCLVSGGNVNFELAGRRFVESFSVGKLGRISLESPSNHLTYVDRGN